MEERGDQSHEVVTINSEGEGRGCNERGHDVVIINSKGKGAGCAERDHDIVMINSEGEGAGCTEEVRKIKGGSNRTSRWVKVNMGGKMLDLYCDTGSNITMYKESMGKVVVAKSYPRAWGLDK